MRFGIGRREVEESLAIWGESVEERGAMSAKEAEEEFDAILQKAWGSDMESAIELMPYLSHPREEHLRRLLARWASRDFFGCDLGNLFAPDSSAGERGLGRTSRRTCVDRQLFDRGL